MAKRTVGSGRVGIVATLALGTRINPNEQHHHNHNRYGKSQTGHRPLLRSADVGKNRRALTISAKEEWFYLLFISSLVNTQACRHRLNEETNGDARVGISRPDKEGAGLSCLSSPPPLLPITGADAAEIDAVLARLRAPAPSADARLRTLLAALSGRIAGSARGSFGEGGSESAN